MTFIQIWGNLGFTSEMLQDELEGGKKEETVHFYNYLLFLELRTTVLWISC